MPWRAAHEGQCGPVRQWPDLPSPTARRNGNAGCQCGRSLAGRAFKAGREVTGAAFYEAGPDGLTGDPAGYATGDARGNDKDSGACPGYGRLFTDTIAGRSALPAAARRPEAPAEPPPALFQPRPALSTLRSLAGAGSHRNVRPAR